MTEAEEPEERAVLVERRHRQPGVFRGRHQGLPLQRDERDAEQQRDHQLLQPADVDGGAVGGLVAEIELGPARVLRIDVAIERAVIVGWGAGRLGGRRIGGALNGVFEPKQKEPLVGDFEMYLRH